MFISGTSNNFTSVIMACMVIQAIVKANGQSNGKGQIYRKRSHCNRIYNWQIFCSTLPFNLHAMLSAEFLHKIWHRQQLWNQKCIQLQVRWSSGTDVYAHTPILCPHAAQFHERCISTVMFTSHWAWPARWPIRLILGFWDSKVHKNGRFPALDTDEPLCKMRRC